MESPCEQQAAALKEAIEEWVQASEVTREYLVRMPTDPHATVEPLHPDFFQQMQEAHDRERQARLSYIRANNLLYDCMERNSLIE